MDYNPSSPALVEAVSDCNFANVPGDPPEPLFRPGLHQQRFGVQLRVVALTQVVSEAILIKKAWAFITNGPVEMIASRDSSVARAVAQRAGVGRVRPLQTSCLWIQMWTAKIRSSSSSRSPPISTQRTQAPKC